MTRSETARRHGNGGNGNGATLPLLDEMPQAMRTMFDTGARLQSELLTLCSHRAQAWINWPRQIMSCKSPADLSAAQGAFLTAMQRHYKEYFDCLVNDAMAMESGVRGGNGGAPSHSAARGGQAHETAGREAA